MEEFEPLKYSDTGMHHDFCRLLAAMIAYTDVTFSHEEKLKFRKMFFERLNFLLDHPEATDEGQSWNGSL